MLDNTYLFAELLSMISASLLLLLKLRATIIQVLLETIIVVKLNYNKNVEQ